MSPAATRRNCGWAWRGALGAALLLTACHQAPPPPQPTTVTTVPAQPLDAALSSSVPSYIAVVRADRETDLGFKVGGVLERLGSADTHEWQEGDLVRRGELLARLRQGQFQSAVDSARATYELTKSVYQRGERLRQENAISQQEWDSIQANHLAAKAALERAETDLADTSLLAPFDARVLSRPVRLGETVEAGHPVLRIGDLKTVLVELGVPDKVVRDFQIQKNREIRLTLPALRNRTLTGQVDEVGVAARENARLFRVVIRVANADEAIKPGMTATVQLPASPSRLPHAVRVPLTALVAGGVAGPDRRLYVFVVSADGRVQRRAVVTDEFIESSIVIAEGLAAGERVVVRGKESLRDGDPVLDTAAAALTNHVAAP